ncbi:Uncharacterized protein TCM_025313 [Theobroma cacao]|uniref:RNase H type-1 domain-containing protein n=1 Tax=Theobroma cacao TaxID=3641 RepID=A0A061EXX0_THECC|nr:Uncharacterized protein TCM_025313 [Theobroma cacao]
MESIKFSGFQILLGEIKCQRFGDVFLNSHPMISLFSIVVDNEFKVVDLWNNGTWFIPFRRSLYSWEKDSYNEILRKLENVFLSIGKFDKLIWVHDSHEPSISFVGRAPLHHRIGISRQPPNDGEFKFNIDGSVWGKPSIASCGGVLQNSASHVVGIFFGPLGFHDSNYAELYAILQALRFYASSPFKDSHLIIESVASNSFADNLAKFGVEKNSMFCARW